MVHVPLPAKLAHLAVDESQARRRIGRRAAFARQQCWADGGAREIVPEHQPRQGVGWQHALLPAWEGGAVASRSIGVACRVVSCEVAAELMSGPRSSRRSQGVAEDVGRFDVVIVGGGAGGRVVAARLSESGSRSVLLVEAGLGPG